MLACATEMVCALGLEFHLVGRSHECDFPEEVVGLPVCSRPGFADASSAQIDASVKDRLRRGLSLYELDLETIAHLKPDLILTQDQCAVCAVTLDQVEQCLQQECGLSAEVFSLRPHTLNDVFDDWIRLGERLGRGSRARDLVAQSWERLRECRASGPQPVPRVVALEWLDPLMGCGSWLPEVVSWAGAEEVLGRAGQPANWTSVDELKALKPDVLLFVACGFGLERTIQEVEEGGILNLLGAVPGRILAFDGNAYFNRSGPRLVDSAELLSHALKFPQEDGPMWRWLR